MNKLEGKVAWITGGGSGIGEAAAVALAQAGAHVVVSGRREVQLAEVVAAISATGGRAEAAPLDVVDAEATMAIADELRDRLGGVDIFMANAGLNVPNRATADLTPADFSRVVDINLNGVMNGVLAVLPHMRAKQEGTIILTSSWAGRFATKMTGSAYNATKHAVVALGQSINMENGEHGIRCTTLMPGEVATPILKTRPQPPSDEDIAKMLKPADMGAIVRFLAEAPPNVCMNEILVSPTRNRIFAS